MNEITVLPEYTRKNLIGLLHQVVFPFPKLYIAYDNADWIRNNRNINPVPPQSYLHIQYIHKQTLPSEPHFYS